MRPREDVIFYDIDEPLSKLIYLFVDQQCSRIPVCKEGLDKVMGIITGHQFFLHRDALRTPQDLLPILTKPFFVPETMHASGLIRQMYSRRESLSLVVDEYGSISGLITLEDLVETVIGEIKDARDTKSRYTRSGDDILIASGKLELAEFEELFGVTMPTENNRVTLGGWLTEQLGDIPKTGKGSERRRKKHYERTPGRESGYNFSFSWPRIYERSFWIDDGSQPKEGLL